MRATDGGARDGLAERGDDRRDETKHFPVQDGRRREEGCLFVDDGLLDVNCNARFWSSIELVIFKSRLRNIRRIPARISPECRTTHFAVRVSCSLSAKLDLKGNGKIKNTFRLIFRSLFFISWIAEYISRSTVFFAEPICWLVGENLLGKAKARFMLW